MILEYGEEQYNCLHRSWGKTNDGYETYWKCMDCGATNETPTSEKTEPTSIPKHMEGVHSDPVGKFHGEFR